MDKKIRIHRGKTKTAVTAPKVTSWKRWGVWGSLCPLLTAPTALRGWVSAKLVAGIKWLLLNLL